MSSVSNVLSLGITCYVSLPSSVDHRSFHNISYSIILFFGQWSKLICGGCLEFYKNMTFLMENLFYLVFIIQAYASYMKGSLLFEQDEHWDIALKCFKSARYIFISNDFLDKENKLMALLLTNK